MRIIGWVLAVKKTNDQFFNLAPIFEEKGEYFDADILIFDAKKDDIIMKRYGQKTHLVGSGFAGLIRNRNMHFRLVDSWFEPEHEKKILCRLAVEAL